MASVNVQLPELRIDTTELERIASAVKALVNGIDSGHITPEQACDDALFAHAEIKRWSARTPKP